MRPVDLKEKGVLNFNKGLYFEAHESWEKLWRGEQDKARKELIQGMIKIAAAFHHLLKGESAGAAKLLNSGLELIQRHEALWDADFPGWDIGKFASEVKALKELPPEKVLCANLPRIVRKTAPAPAHF